MCVVSIFLHLKCIAIKALNTCKFITIKMFCDMYNLHLPYEIDVCMYCIFLISL